VHAKERGGDVKGKLTKVLDTLPSSLYFLELKL
jgi:hypothetical protein